MKRFTRWLLLPVGGVLILALLLLGWLYTSLPRLDGVLTAEGNKAKIILERDALGIVTIRAQNWEDGYFGLGFAHAQDRLGQMEIMRRFGNGRLAEILGERGLNADKFSRLIGLRHLAEMQWQEASSELKNALIAYSNGVNAFLKQRSGALPPELLLLNISFSMEEWTPVDSLLWGRIMALRLSSNRYEEALNYRLQKMLPPELFSAISSAPLQGASNNWVVSAALSQSGKPLLANDPHLELSAPSPWYLAKVVTPDGWRAGATAPGLPFIVLGTNGNVAWGFTTTAGDTQDLFIETKASANTYLTPEGIRPFEEWEERIAVKDEIRTFVFRRTHHGPVISDITDPPNGPVMAMAWAGFAEHDRSAESLLQMNQAGNAKEFYQALRNFHSPQQNILYADKNGEIGFVAAGRVPIRKRVNALSLLPVPGDKGEYDWTGWILFEDLPQSRNEKYLATANNDITKANSPFFIAGKWESNYRINRIHELLEKRTNLTLADMAGMQLDILSPAAREFGPQLASVAEGEIADLLKDWDFKMDKNKPQGAIFTLWLSHWAKTLATQALGVEYDKWFFWQIHDLKKIATQCKCPERVKISLAFAIDELKSRLGNNPNAWKWGDLHRVAFTHPLLGNIPIIGSWLNENLPADGDNFTLNRASPDPLNLQDIHGPTLRFIIDMADPASAQFSVAGGQSGNILSPHYSDMLEDWNEGAYTTMLEPVRHRLTLE